MYRVGPVLVLVEGVIDYSVPARWIALRYEGPIGTSYRNVGAHA
jgi:hypothetical protein